jgi:hypothetical protein
MVLQFSAVISRETVVQAVPREEQASLNCLWALRQTQLVRIRCHNVRYETFSLLLHGFPLPLQRRRNAKQLYPQS